MDEDASAWKSSDWSRAKTWGPRSTWTEDHDFLDHTRSVLGVRRGKTLLEDNQDQGRDHSGFS